VYFTAPRRRAVSIAPTAEGGVAMFVGGAW
jgi:hypothetical protein